MLQHDPRFSALVTRTVGELEQSTTAELVVVAATRSASHWTAALATGMVAAWLALLATIVLPVSFDPMWTLVELPLVAYGVARLTLRSPLVLRTVLGERRLDAAVSLAASAAFAEEHVHGTRRRTGVLIYLSGVEGRIRVVADGGVEAKVPPGIWAQHPWNRGSGNRSQSGVRTVPAPASLDEFIVSLRNLGSILAAHLPADPHDNPDELPDAPRIRE